MDENVIKNVIKARNAIRKKFKALKTGKMETETQLEETFKPITSSLKELKNVVKLEPKDETKVEPKEEMYTPPSYKYLKMEQPSEEDISNEAAAADETISDTSIHSSSFKKPSISELMKRYQQLIIFNSNDIDKNYGVHYNTTEDTWKMGNSSFEFGDDVIIINKKPYTATEGLLELLFMKKPTSYTKNDLNNYYSILNNTNVHRRDYDATQQISGSRTYKYKNIIKKLIDESKKKQKSTPHKGKGIMRIPKTNIDYLYWDDPNELVDRLRILIASQQAGNNSHNNEIISIIEELREAEIIV